MRRYKVIRAFALPFVKFFLRYKLENKEKIPDIPFVLCANHVSLADPVILACAFKTPVRFMAKSELNKGALGFVLRQLEVVYVNREQADLGAIRQCVGSLKEGTSVGIFPQGTRVEGQARAEQALDGIAMICALGKTGALPVALIYKKGRPKLFRRTRVVVGDFIPVEELASVGDRAAQSRYIFGKVCEMIDNG
ncbi:MAG: 1-acyl-sn-glycerol-3-phosphate acyltransferase [Clostridia bacterium]|nr:1-acyl-sn-glycerol-3-phosphate acyltransferase [Clostridia bacterium]